MRRWVGLALRVGVSAGLLYLLYRTVDTGELVGRLRGMEVTWVAVALGLSVAQVCLSAWRWAYTARKLGLDLPFRAALSEYYLASFLNQVLPGGVAGDVSRAWRHGRSEAREDGGKRVAWPAVHAVVLERLSGQLAIFAVALASAAAIVARGRGGLPVADGAVAGGAVEGGGILAGGAVTWAILIGASSLLLAAVGVLGRRMLESRAGADAAGWVLSAGTALLAPGVWRVQGLTSGAVVLSYLGVYLAGAAAVGVETPLWVLAPLVAPVLLAMLVPVTVAGWGLREGAAALIWTSAGLTAADGVTLSVAYGLLVLLSTLPGAVVLLLPTADPGRRAGPNPA